MQPKMRAAVRITTGVVAGVVALLYGLYVALPTFVQDMGETMRLNSQSLDTKMGTVTDVDQHGISHVVTGTKRVTVKLADGKQLSRDSLQYVTVRKAEEINVGLHNNQMVTFNGLDVRSPVNLIIMLEVLVLGLLLVVGTQVTTGVFDSRSVVLVVCAPVVTVAVCLIERQALILVLVVPLYCTIRSAHAARIAFKKRREQAVA